jgi:hypothetical protein
LISLLDTVFGDPNRIATTERELEHLTQGSRDFSAYFANFQRLAADVDWNEQAQKHALTRGLSNDLRNAMIHHRTPGPLIEYIRLLQ